MGSLGPRLEKQVREARPDLAPEGGDLVGIETPRALPVERRHGAAVHEGADEDAEGPGDRPEDVVAHRVVVLRPALPAVVE